MKALGRNYRPLCYVEKKLLCYKREKLYLVDTNNFEVEELCPFPIEDSRRPVCFCDFGERLAHIYAYCGIEVEDGALVAFNRGIYKINLKTRLIEKEFEFKLADMRRPLSFFEIKNLEGFDNCVVFGDYSFNKERHNTKIWRRISSGKWEVAYEFPKGAVRHIHSIITDIYRKRVLVLTGDFGDECAIWEFKDNFKHVRKIIGSEQKYRACCARAYPEGVMIVTDSPFDQNYVYVINEIDNKVKVSKSGEIAGPAVFFTYFRDKVIFSTDVEYDESSVSGPIQYISYKRGPGVHDWFSHLYCWSPSDGLKEITKFKKDFWPMVTLGFGQIAFPYGEDEKKVFFYPTAVKRVNQKLCCLIWKDDGWKYENS